MKLFKYIIVGGVLVSTGQVFAEEDTSSEIRALKAKLKMLEQRIDSQQRHDKGEARTAAKAAPSVFDPCPAGKVCYKGVTLTFGGWVDLAGIFRSRNLASDTGSVYSFIPFAQSKNFKTPEARFSARQSRFSLLAEGDAGAKYAPRGLRRDRL